MILNSKLVEKLKFIALAGPQSDPKKFRQINECQKIQSLGTIRTRFKKVWAKASSHTTVRHKPYFPSTFYGDQSKNGRIFYNTIHIFDMTIFHLLIWPQ